MVKTVRSRSRKINFKSRIAVRHATFDFGDEQAVDYHEVQELGHQASDKPDQVETGVDKEEESELHLQNAISAQAQLVSRSSAAHQTRSSGASSSGPVASSSKAAAAAAPLPYIPTPDAKGTVEDYDALYLTHGYTDPHTYIRFSDTVEDATGVAYNMDEDDEDWLIQYNKEHKPGGGSSSANKSSSSRSSPGRKDKGKEPADAQPLSEYDFELIMDHFEVVTEEKMPTLHIDPSKMPSFADFEPTFADSPHAAKLEPLRPIAKAVYEYWKSRRLERSGKVIMPALDHDESREDNPYVCFRRRDPKNVRKTRRTESQNLDRLIKLSTDLQAAHELASKTLDRERLKRDNVAQDKAVFEGRVQLRDLKRKAGEKAGDDDLLITRKEKRRKPEEMSAQMAASSGYKLPIRIPPRQAVDALPPGQTVPATPVIAPPVHLSSEHSTNILQRIDREISQRREADHEMDDFTDGAFCPLQPSKLTHGWQQADAALSAPLPHLSQHDCPPPFDLSRPSFRRRTGRGGRAFVDRTGFQRQRAGASPTSARQLRSSHQWKFDTDADELPNFDASTVLDDTELKYQLSRLDWLQPGDLSSLRPNPQHLIDSQAWICRPPDKAPPTQVIGKIAWKPLPPPQPAPQLPMQPSVQPIAQQQQQQHKMPQGLPQSSVGAPIPGQQHPMLPPHHNTALLSLKRGPPMNGGSPQMPNGAPLPPNTGSPMPQPPPGPRRMPSNPGGVPQQMLQQLPNGQMIPPQWSNKMDPATLQNLAQAQAHSLATPRLPAQYQGPGVNGTPRLPAQYTMMSPPNGLSPFGEPAGMSSHSPNLSRPPSVAGANGSPSQGPKQQLLPPQAQPA